MAIGDYKFDIPTEPEIGANSSITFHNIRLYRVVGENPLELDEVREGGHFSIRIPASQAQPILQGNGSDAQKRQAILQLMIEQVKDRGLAQSHDTYRRFMDTLPGKTWPDGGFSPSFSLD